MKTLTKETKLDQLRADLERLSRERDAAVAERDSLLKALEQSSADRVQLEQLAAQLGQDKTRLEQLAAQLGQDKAKLEKALAALDHKYQQLCQQLFGRSSEKVGPDELADAIREEEEQSAQAEAGASAPPHVDEAADGETPEVPIPELPPSPPEDRRRRKGHGRRPRSKKVRRKKVLHPLPPEELVCDCCGGQRRSIGSDETTERYDYQPSSVVIVEHVRPRYRCPTCQDGTITAPLPPAPISRGLAEPGLLAYVAASKFGDHLPLNRLRGILLREGVDVPRSTLCDWVHATGGLLKGIAEEVCRNVLSRYVVGMDETGIRIIFDPKDKENGTRNGKIWVYRGLKGEVYFRVSETKAHADANGPLAVLRHYKGLVQADAAGIFDILFEDGTRIEVGCNAHARRKFVQAKKTHLREVAFVLKAYQQVYKIEAKVRGASPEERRAARQAESKPILDALDAFLDALAPTLVPGTPMATAVNYSINHRTALRRFLDDGRLEADNNAVERALRLVAVGRKNWLFAGSEGSAKTAAILYTLVGGCKDLGLDPWEYLRDVIARLSADPKAPVSELTPRAWAEARSQE